MRWTWPAGCSSLGWTSPQWQTLHFLLFPTHEEQWTPTQFLSFYWSYASRIRAKVITVTSRQHGNTDMMGSAESPLRQSMCNSNSPWFSNKLHRLSYLIHWFLALVVFIILILTFCFNLAWKIGIYNVRWYSVILISWKLSQCQSCWHQCVTSPVRCDTMLINKSKKN